MEQIGTKSEGHDQPNECFGHGDASQTGAEAHIGSTQDKQSDAESQKNKIIHGKFLRVDRLGKCERRHKFAIPMLRSGHKDFIKAPIVLEKSGFGLSNRKKLD